MCGRRQAFGKYLAAISLQLEKRYSVPLYAISIQNELVFTEGYESCAYSPGEYHDTIKAVGEAFKKWNVKSKIFGHEDVGIKPGRVMGFVDAVMKDPATRDDLQIFAVHGYNDDGVNSDEGKSPKAHNLRDRLSHYGRELWMTESSGEDPTWLNRHWGALGLGWMIHNSLANGDCSAYVYWQITNGPDAHKAGESLMTGDQPSPKFYAAKHFFKFIRPGARRVETTPTDKDGLAVSAYEHVANGTLTIVLVNTADHGFNVKLHIKDSPITGFDIYRSTEQDHCKLASRATADNGVAPLDMPANSMITLFGPGGAH